MLWICEDCGTKYAVGLERCPQCGSENYYEQGTEPMPKSTIAGGASNAAVDPPADTPEPQPKPEAEVKPAAKKARKATKKAPTGNK